jgi:hypothetical protein
MYPDHFLDSNVLVGLGIKWDTHHRGVQLYIGRTGLKRHTSSTVFQETKNVLFKRKQLIRACLDSLAETDFAENPTSISPRLAKQRDHYISKLNEDDDRNVLRAFFYRTFDDIVNELGKDPATGLPTYCKKAVQVMNNATRALYQDCATDHNARVQLFSVPRRLPYTTKQDRLSRIIQHEKDVRVVLDSYYIKNYHIQSNVSFVTNDEKHFLNRKDAIEKELPGINIQPPLYAL